ncbi:MAG: hypothetical protein J6M07_00610, partial [Ruminococcus sp.]|nr:hypothetical protein [Ruminococcus sp.]
MSSNISKFLYDINNEKGIKGWLKRRIFGCILPAFEALDKDIGSSRVPLKENESDLRRDLETVSINVRNNNTLLERLDSVTAYGGRGSPSSPCFFSGAPCMIRTTPSTMSST